MYIAVAAYADRTRFLFNNNYVLKRHHKMNFFLTKWVQKQGQREEGFYLGGWVGYNRKGVRVYWYMGL